MSTSKRIDDIVYNYPMGDVEQYFQHINNIHTANSGNNDYRMTAQDSYQISVPINGGQFTRFKLTDPAMDVVDISQGYINLKCHLDYDFIVELPEGYVWGEDEEEKIVTTHGRNACWFFVGFKSGSQLIKSYNVYSNGRPTACKQLRSIYEQSIVYASKAKEERAGRPGMYSVHKDVLKMRDCVCGVYIQQPLGLKQRVTESKWTGALDENNEKTGIDLDLVIQVDDLLPFSAMTYFPQFACGELELEVMCEIERNMVFCQVPYEEVIAAHPFQDDTKAPNYNDVLSGYYSNADTQIPSATSVAPVLRTISSSVDNRALLAKNVIDTRFHQCGDFARCYIGLSKDETGTTDKRSKYDIQSKNALWSAEDDVTKKLIEAIVPVAVPAGKNQYDPAEKFKYVMPMGRTINNLNEAAHDAIFAHKPYIQNVGFDFTQAAATSSNGSSNYRYTEAPADTVYLPIENGIPFSTIGATRQTETNFLDCHVTIIPKNLVITEAKSYIFGFNLKPEAKANCIKVFENNGNLTIPAQWIEHMNPAQSVNISNLKITTTMPLWQCGQVIFTFPNSANQLTVSRNPYLKALRCQIGNKLIPDKNMTTIDKAHAEMTLTALGFDSLFAAPKSLLTALAAKNEYASKFYPKHDDDSDYMFICDMERNGNSIYHDGISGQNVPILFDAEFINDTENPHYYAYDASQDADHRNQLRKMGINIFSVSDAYWVFGREGGEFVKDHRALAITKSNEQ